jgi:DNA-binding MltR family transcriptional regulator
MPRKKLQDIDLDRFSERLSSESDRACAVLGAALLDAKLEAVFRTRLGAFQDDLLGNTQPLGAFGTRIRLACALGWISDDARADLDTIRTIRNDFAHSFDHDLTFTDDSISDRCSNLKTSQAYIDGFDIAATAPDRKLGSQAIHNMQDVFKPPRWRFHLAVDFLVQYFDFIASDGKRDPIVTFLDDISALSANIRVEIRGELSVGPPPGS